MNTFSINSNIHNALRDVLNTSSLGPDLAYMNDDTKDAVATLALSSIEKPENIASYLNSHEKCNPIGYLKAIEWNTNILDSKVVHLITQEERDTYSVGIIESSISSNSSFEDSVVNNSHDVYDYIMPKLLEWEDILWGYDGFNLTTLLKLNLTRESKKAITNIKNLISKYEFYDLGTVIFEFLDNFQLLKREYFIRFHRNLVNDLDSLYLKEGQVVYCD